MSAGYEFVGAGADDPRQQSCGGLRAREMLSLVLIIFLGVQTMRASMANNTANTTAMPVPQSCSITGPLSPHAQISDAAYRQFLYYMPVPTCDVLLFGPGHNTTLLFLRANRPVQGVWYSLGGRVLKNETLRACAARKLFAEFGLRRPETSLVYGGTMEEHFTDSAFEGINSHCINNVFAYVLSPRELRDFAGGSRSAHMALDRQHSQSRWFATDDASLHPYVATKVALVRSALSRQTSRQAAALGQELRRS